MKASKWFMNVDLIEGVRKNLRLVPGHFSPTSGPASAMGYLERKLLRFQGLIWCINHFCILSSCRDIVKNAKVPIFGNFLFCKKNLRLVPGRFSPTSGPTGSNRAYIP